MDQKDRRYIKYSESEQFLTQEERLVTHKPAKSLVVGIPNEISFQENRIALVPPAVGMLTAHGHKVFVENNAGVSAGYTNNDFSEAGAHIVYSREEIFQTDVIIKVAPPTDEEIGMMRGRQVLLSSLNWSVLGQEFFRKLMARKITAIAYEYLRDKAGDTPVMRAMSEIAGSTSMLIAARYLADTKIGKGIMLGGFSGIAPTEVVILGAGTVGEYSSKAALGLSALVKVFDNSIYKLKRLQSNLNNPIYTSVIQPGILTEALKTADVVIGALYSSGVRNPCYVTSDMIRKMKDGAVIIDVSIDHGGCFETSRMTSHPDPVFKEYGVIHYCVPNIPSMVPNTASRALSNILGSLLVSIGEEGGIESALRSMPAFLKGVYIYNGISTNRFISDYFSLPYQDMNLLMAAWEG